MAEYLLKHFQVGSLGTNCYMVACPQTKKAMVIDPGASAKKIFEEAQKEGWQIVYIVDTHGHWDHIGANKELQALTGAPILIHADDADYLRDSQLNIAGFFRKDGDGGEAAQLLHDGDTIQVGDLRFRVISSFVAIRFFSTRSVVPILPVAILMRSLIRFATSCTLWVMM